MFPLAALAQEQTVASSALSLRGFGTLGMARSSNGDAAFLRDVSQPKGVGGNWSGHIDSILGLQANYEINDATEVVVQGVSHYRYDGSFSPELTWAFIKYDLSPRLSFRLGRIGTEFLMQSDSRMVGYSYLTVRPNADFYAGVPVNYGDGVDAQIRWPVGDGVLRGGLFAGYAQEKLPPYELKNSPIFKASLGYDEGDWQFRYIYARSSLANDIKALDPLRSGLVAAGAMWGTATPAQAADAMGLAGRTSQYHSLGIAYDDGTWQAQAAIDSIQHESVLFQDSHAAYVIVAHRFGSVSPFAGYSRGKSNRKSLATGLPDAFFSELNGGVARALGSSHQDRRTLTLGTRWDFARNMDLKAQLDFVRGDASALMLYDQYAQPGWNGRTTVMSVVMDFVF